MYRPDGDLILFPSQLKWLYQILKRKIWSFSIFIFCSVFICLHIRSGPFYSVEATFKQSQNRQEDVSQLQTFLQNMIRLSQDSNAISIMKSKKLLRRVVETMGLQIQPPAPSIFSRIWRNFAAEMKIFIEDREDFEFKQVSYNQENPSLFYLKFLSNEKFELLNAKKQFVAQGDLKQKLSVPDLEFIVEKTPSKFSLNKLYSFSVLPWASVVNGFETSLKIKPSKTDKALLVLTLLSDKRHLGAKILNQIMDQFQLFLVEEHEEFSKSQEDYLEKRQLSLGNDFNESLNQHAQYLALNLNQNGFLGLSQEMEMLAIPKEDFTSKLFDLDLELKRWAQLDEGRKDFAASKKELEYQKKLVALSFEEHPFLSPGKLISPTRFEAQFLGIDLEKLKKIYAEYSQEKELLQAQIDDSIYVQKQMLSPQFEISSLSSLLKDPVSVDMIAKASHLSLELHDESNRSPKEQERIKEALEAEKKFISNYLKQTLQHLKIKLHLIEEKMAFLQNKALQLIQNEKTLIDHKLSDLQLQMKDFPQKWLLENQLKMKRDLTLKIIEGMTKLTESKVVNHHLFQVESKPLDAAFAPLLPKRPYIFLFSVLGGLIAGVLYYFVHFVKKFFSGFPLVPEWFEENNLHFSGNLLKIKNHDLETFRNIASFITSKQQQTILISGINNPELADTLAELLKRQGLKILMVQTTFHSDETPGLLQFLSGDEKLSRIKKFNSDFIPSGGYTGFGPELLNHPKFSAVLSDLKKEYDHILLLNSSRPSCPSISCLFKHIDGIVSFIHEETPQEIRGFIEWGKRNGSLTFVKF